MKDCPDRDLLERLLNNRLIDTELDELDRHVRGCASCRQILEELTGDPTRRSEPRHESSLMFTDLERDSRAETAGVTTAASERSARVVPAVSGYEIKGELGRGGMGVVYEARHVRLNRPCALKMTCGGSWTVGRSWRGGRGRWSGWVAGAGATR
jgi:eukaryotic-like serine/threonine-protein kinase